MKFKAIAATAAITAAFIGFAIPAPAAEVPNVTVNGHLIHFEDLDPFIENDVTMVPVKTVFRAMGCSVKWLGDTQQVQISSEDNLIRVVLTLDSPVMEIYHFQNMWHSERSEVELESPMTIRNDKSALPLRAIAEAMGAQVSWDDANTTAEITTADKPEFAENAVKFTLSTDAQELTAGETFHIYLNAENFNENYPGYVYANASLALYYNPENFNIVEAHIIDENGEAQPALDVVNGEFLDGILKTVSVLTNFDSLPSQDGKMLEITMESLNGEGGEFVISDGYMDIRGYDSAVGLYSPDGKLPMLDPDSAVFDTTPLVIE